MSKNIILILFLNILPLILFPQKSIYLNENKINLSIEKNEIYNTLINEFNINIDFNANRLINVLLTENYYKVYVKYNSLKCSDIVYKNFNISNYIKPDNISVQFDIFNNNIKLKSYTSKLLKEKETYTTFETFYDSILLSNLSVIVNNESLILTIENLNDINKYKKEIDDYYNIDSRLLVLKDNFKNIDIANYNSVDETLNKIGQLKKTVETIEKQPLFKDLNINENDPINILNKINKIKFSLDSMLRISSSTKNNLHIIYYNDALNYFNNNEYDKAEEMLQKTISINNKFPDSYLLLAKLSFIQNYYADAMYNLIDLAENTKPSDSIINQAKILTADIINIYIKKAQTQIDNSFFQLSIEILSKLDEFCNKVNFMKCPELVSSTQKNARIGFYNSLFVKIKKEIETDNIIEAKKLLSQAEKFKQEYSLIIYNESINNEIKAELYYKEYLLELKTISTIIQSNQLTKSSEKIDSLLLFVEKLILPNKNYQSIISNIIEKHIEIGNKYLLLNKLDSAILIKDKVNSLSIRYKLPSSLIVFKSINGYSSLVNNKLCNNKIIEFNSLLWNAEELVKNLNYRDADDIIVNLFSNYNSSDCNYDFKKATFLKNQISQIVKYIRLIDSINLNIAQLKYNNIDELYSKAEVFFNENLLYKKGILHLKYIDFIKNNSSKFILYNANNYMKNNNLDESLYLLKELRIRKYTDENIKSIQEELAEKIAIKDNNENNALFPDDNLLKYTNNDEWFKYFNKNYIKQIKKLKN